jgi:hypothetical protein
MNHNEPGDVDSENKPTTSHPNSSTLPSADTGDGTSQRLSSEESASNDEVQSTQSNQNPPKTHYPGMIFDFWEAAKLHYNKYAKTYGFSIKTSTSWNYTLDKQKEKCIFV